MKAKFIKSLTDFTGDASLYKLEPQLQGNDYVVVSATYAPFSGPETFIFPSNENGDIENWGELNGSYQGGLSHETALSNAGYEIES